MERSEIKLEIPETLVTDEMILDSAGTDLTDSAVFGTNHEGAIDLKQEGLINNSVNCVMNNETQNEKMGISLTEPSLSVISNLVVIAPQDDNFSKCELFETNRKRPYSQDHQEDINQDPTIPPVKQEIMDVVIKHEINEDVSMEEFDGKQVQGETRNCEEHITLEEDMNSPWLDNLKETDHTQAQPVTKKEMSENSHQEDLVKSERIDEDLSDDQTLNRPFSKRVSDRRSQPGTSTVTSPDERSDYDESCALISGKNLNKKENLIDGNKSVPHLCSDHSDAQSDTESLENHSLTHSQSNKSFKCPDCDKEFQKLRYLKNHAVVHANINPITCAVCGLVFQSKGGFSEHRCGHNSKKASSLTRERPLVCEVCNKSSPHTTSFHDLMITHQCEKPYTCTTCDKSYMTWQAFQCHQRIHTGERPYACTICDKSFMTQQSLERHQIAHPVETPFRCSTCDKTFKTQLALNLHQTTHNAEKPYACTTCDKSYMTQQNLQRHQIAHTGEKPYTCSMCDKSFRNKHHLKQHEMTHMDEKPYACTECDKSYRTQLDLKVHQRTHTGEKPYACSTCDKRFTTKSGVKRHQTTHAEKKEYVCVICDKIFKTQSNLMAHQRTHTGEYACITCDKSFTTRYHVMRHQFTCLGK